VGLFAAAADCCRPYYDRVMLTAGTWLGPILGSIILAVGLPVGLRWRPGRKKRAMQRIAERLAYEDSTAQGYPGQYDMYLEHYTGGRDWHDRWGKEVEPGSTK
jgi:hypothetical protein